MKIKISEASGVMLDWLVAKCEGDEPVFRLHKHSKGATIYRNEGLRQGGIDFRPSIVWAQGGPIVEREGIATDPNGPYVNGRIVPESWCAKIDEVTSYIEGPTPLIAALRCYAVSKLGEEVEVPDELA